MASNIDATKPQQGAASTANVRDNFAAAKSEIEALQAATENGALAELSNKVAFTSVSGVAVVDNYDITYIACDTRNQVCTLELPDPINLPDVDATDPTKVSLLRYVLHNYTDGLYIANISVSNTSFNNGLSQLALQPGYAAELWAFKEPDGLGGYNTGVIVHYLRGAYLFEIRDLGPYLPGDVNPVTLTGGTFRDLAPNAIELLPSGEEIRFNASGFATINVHGEVEWTGSNQSSNFTVVTLTIFLDGVPALVRRNTLPRRTGATIPLDVNFEDIPVTVGQELTFAFTSDDGQDYVLQEFNFQIVAGV